MNELVSIIMPLYNCEKYVKDAISSVISQTFTNWELIIVDDYSSDNSINIVNSIKDKRIKLLQNKKNIGAALSRNKALKTANGRWIAFLDSDDVWDETKLEKQIKFMIENNYSFSYTNYIKHYNISSVPDKIISGPKIINKVKLNNYCYMGCLTIMYDSTKIGLVQIKKLSKNNDYAMWLQIIKKYNCYLLDLNLAKYNVRKGSISNQNYLTLIKHHYYLWKFSENKNFLSSIIMTLRNIIFGISKKIKYEKEI